MWVLRLAPVFYLGEKEEREEEMLNKVFLIGNLGKKPNLYEKGEFASCYMSLATLTSWVDKNTRDKKQQTEWHDVVAFGRQAVAHATHLAKGSQVHVEGYLQSREYTNKEGQKVRKTQIVAQRITYLSKVAPKAEYAPSSPVPDDVPF